MKSKKFDLILIGVILIFSLGLLVVGRIIDENDGLTAHVEVNGVHKETIPLHQLADEVVRFPVRGFLGDWVYIVAKHNAIKVEEINCHHQICAAHGFVSSTIRPIVCLPNRIVIRLVGGHIDANMPDVDIST